MLEKNWEYVGHDLSYKEFKTQINIYVKNRCHARKLLIEANVARLGDCRDDHWESMKRLIASKTKQEEATRYCAMRTKVNTLSHYGHGGDVGTIGKLVKLLTFRKTLLFVIY